MTRWPPLAFPILVVVGIVGTVVALLLDAHDTLAAWLAAAVATSSVSIGALCVLMISYLVRGRWTNQLHIPLAAASLTIPIAGLLFIPILVGMPWLYPWTSARPDTAFKATYLAPWFFAGRTVLYFVVWSTIACWMRLVWGDTFRMTRAASAGLIVYALSASLASIDWIELLSPNFHSSIYGLILITFQILAGYSFAIAMVTTGRDDATPLPGYGGLMLSTLLLWGYIQAMQYITIWSANIPREAVWYLSRQSGGWLYLYWAIIALQFIVPFFALLSERVRNGALPLWIIACDTLVMRLLESCLLVLPAADAQGPVLWLAVPSAVAATIGILGQPFSSCSFGWSILRRIAGRFRPPADEKKSDPTQHNNDGERRGHCQPASDRERVDASRGIVTVAKQPQVIDKTANLTLAGFDQRQPQARCIEPECRQNSCHPAVGCYHENACWMGKLVAGRLVSNTIAERRSDLLFGFSIGKQKRGGGAKRAGPDLLTSHCLRVRRAILRIKPDDHKVKILARREPGLGETGSGNGEDRATQRVTGKVRQNQHRGVTRQEFAEPVCHAIVVAQHGCGR